MKVIMRRDMLAVMVSIPLVIAAVFALLVVFGQDALQNDFDKIRIGMLYDDAYAILGTKLRAIPDQIEERIDARTTFNVVFAEPDSIWAPGRAICLEFYLDDKSLAKKSGVYRPNKMEYIWDHWERQLGF